MLVADPTTGYLHEVPDYAGWGGYGEPPQLGGWYGAAGLGEADPYALGYGEGPYPVAYDGFGNPVGAFPALAALAPLAAKILPMALPAVASALPGLLKSLLGNPQLGYAPGYGYPGAGGLGYYAEPEAFDGYYGEPQAFDGYYSEPYVDPAMGYSGYSAGGPQQVVYDGFGNPVGAFPALAALLPLAAKVLPAVLPALPSLLSSLFGGKRKRRPPSAPGLGGWGEADFGGYGYYAAPGYSSGYAPLGYSPLGGAPAGLGGYGQVVYDGFGNPVGAFPALSSLVSSIVPAITRAIPRVTGLIQRVLPQARRVVQALAPRGLAPVVRGPAITPLLPPQIDAGPGGGPEPETVVPVTPVTPVVPVTPFAPAPLAVPYPMRVRVPGSPQDIAYCRQLLRAGGGPGRRRRARRRGRG